MNLLLFISFLSLLIPKISFAVDAIDPEAIKQKVIDRLEEIKTKPEQETKQGLLGNISEINEKTIIIEFQESNFTINTDETTTFIDSKLKKTTIEKFKVGQDILVLGILQEPSILLGKRVIQTDASTINRLHQVVVGKIVDISKSSPIIVVIPTQHKDTQFQIKLDTKTSIINSTNSKIEQKDLKTGQKVIVSMIQDDKNSKTYSALKLISL